MKVTQEDYNAGLLALQVYDRIHTRSPFGRATTLVENAKWDNGRKVLSYYNADLAINESWKKKNIENYINDAGQFLNRLNEAYHKDGYHIGMTGITEGTIYVARDAENNNYEYNSSEGEYMYEQECAYRQYLINKANCQRQLRGMVVEAAILSDNQISISEKVDKLYALNEGLGDSVKDAWGKFKAFLSKIWQKFTEFVARTINTDKSYLEKYKDIILHRKWKDENKNLEIDAQYAVGITRLSQFTVATPTAADINQALAATDEDSLKFYQKKLMPAYTNNQTVEFNDFCKHWFKGGDGKGGKHDLTSGEINFTDMYNFCYNYNKIISNLNKNQGIMNNAATVFQNAAKEAAGKKRDEAAAAAAAKAAPPQVASIRVTDAKGDDKSKTSKGKWTKIIVTYDELDNTGKTIGQGKTKEITLTNPYDEVNTKCNELRQKTKVEDIKESFDHYRYKGKLGTFILEAVGTSTSGGGTASNPSNFGNMSTKGGHVRQMADTSHSVDSKQTDADIDKKVGFFTQAASSVFSSMCTAAQVIKTDYMKIIKMHVQSYLGEDKDSDNKIAQQAGTNRTVDIKYTDEEIKLASPNSTATLNINGKNYKLDELEKLDQNDPNNKAIINDALNILSNLHKETNSQAPLRTYSSISEYREAVNAQVQAAQSQTQQQQGQGQQNTSPINVGP